MSLLDVVKQGYKGWLVKSKSTTTPTVEYPGLRIQRWNLLDTGQVQEVMGYVREKLQGHMISCQIAGKTARDYDLQMLKGTLYRYQQALADTGEGGPS